MDAGGGGGGGARHPPRLPGTGPGEQASLAKAPRVPTGRPAALAAGAARGPSKFGGVFCKVPGRAEGRRAPERVRGKAGCGRRGRAEGRLRSFLPWERKGRDGEGAMCRNVGPLGEAGAESGKWGAGGTAGAMDQAPCPSPTAAFQAGQGMRSSRPVPLGPRQPTAGRPLPPAERPSPPKPLASQRECFLAKVFPALTISTGLDIVLSLP